ncbi:Hypp6372 [Branchiostoma lanceolatum]|uniref:Hypp6372 protein n=2 Tax=Branchiostoma lanceolatum TaxID=7740 RepID=A0A8J9YTQ3_BRALA|nr:Hypp6372 [Branchiostoma lanceolatum]
MIYQHLLFAESSLPRTLNSNMLTITPDRNMADHTRYYACVLLLTSCCGMLGCIRAEDVGEATLVYQWASLDYDWPDDATRQSAIDEGRYVPENIIATGIKVHGPVVYLTTPRWRDGVPASLSSVVETSGGRAVLRPFPSWEMNQLGNCSALQSVQSMEVDPLGRMWIADVGGACAPKLIIYDIKTDDVIRTYTFPSDVANTNDTYLNDIVIDTSADDPDDWFAYISNSRNPGGLVVYDYRRDSSHKVFHSSMNAEPDATLMTINGRNYTFDVASDGIALSPLGNNMKVYYCALSGYNLYSVPTSVIKQPVVTDISSSVKQEGRKVSQSDGLVVSQEGNLYFAALHLNAVYRWDTSSEDVSSATELVSDDVTMQWADTFAFDDEGYLWFIANRLHMWRVNELTFTGSEQNFLVWKVYVGEKSYMHKSGGKTIRADLMLCLVAVLYAVISTM